MEFNIRGKKQKVLSKKEKAKLDAKIRLNIRREQIKKDNERKKKEIDAAPVSVMDKKGNQNFIKQTVNEYDFVATTAADVDLGLGSDSSSDGDFDTYDVRVQKNKK